MLKALLRFIFFFLPLAFLNGVSFIIFDGVEILSVDFELDKRKKKSNKKQELKIVKKFLKDCYKKDQISE